MNDLRAVSVTHDRAGAPQGQMNGLSMRYDSSGGISHGMDRTRF
jgi:hypothetical protein